VGGLALVLAGALIPTPELGGRAPAIQDVYEVRAALHFAVGVGAWFLLFAALYGVLDVWLRLDYRRVLGWAHLGLTTLGTLLATTAWTPLLLLRRPATAEGYADYFEAWNRFATAGYLLVWTSLILFAGVLLSALLRRRR
jgi:heme/copper-type cytochrome/quinol oxidase subunit 1